MIIRVGEPGLAKTLPHLPILVFLVTVLDWLTEFGSPWILLKNWGFSGSITSKPSVIHSRFHMMTVFRYLHGLGCYEKLAHSSREINNLLVGQSGGGKI